MEISEIKTHLDIYQVAERLRIQINKYHKALCPFHDDKRPSLQFSREKQIATCFSGHCTAGTMDVIGLVEKKLNLNTSEAITWLQKEFAVGTSITANKKPGPTTGTVNYPKLFRVFEGNLKKSSKGKAYLESRGLDAKKLQAGYNGTAWGQMKYCIIFPLKDKSGQVVSLYGRSVVNNPATAGRHFYSTNRQGLYPGYPPVETQTLLLTESIIDCATLMHCKLPIIHCSLLSLYGTNGLTAEHIEAIKSLRQLKEVILFFDGDEAGKAAAEKYSTTLPQLL